MTRRGLLLLAKRRDETAPIDPESINAFTVAYRKYLESLMSGRVNLALWRQCIRLFDSLR